MRSECDLAHCGAVLRPSVRNGKWLKKAVAHGIAGKKRNANCLVCINNSATHGKCQDFSGGTVPKKVS